MQDKNVVQRKSFVRAGGRLYNLDMLVHAENHYDQNFTFTFVDGVKLELGQHEGKPIWDAVNERVLLEG